jgi:hypothetical protein
MIFAVVASVRRFTAEQLGCTVAVAMSLFGIVDVALVCRELGVVEGLLACAHDPGKSFYHVVILPLAVMCLSKGFPVDVLKRQLGYPSRRILLAFLGIAFVGAAVIFAVCDVHDGFTKRLPWPADVSRSIPGQSGQCAQDELQAIRSSLRAHLLAEPGADPQVALAKYKGTVEALLGTDRSFWVQSSIRAKWAAILTVLGAAFAGALLWVIAALLLALSCPQDTLQSMVAVVTLSTWWIPLRAYSEWYGNVENISLAMYPPFIVGGATVAAALVFIWLRLEWKNPAKVALGTATVITAVIGVVGKVNPDLVASIGKGIESQSLGGLIALYTVVAGVVLGLSFVFMRRPPQ